VTARCAALRVALLGVLLPAPAWAQALQPSPAGPFRPWSIEIDAGILWSSGIDLGSTTASITANQTPAVDYPLFDTAADLDAAPGFEGRIGLWITRIIGVEGAFQYSRPTLETRISGDVENAPVVTATANLSRYVIDVSGIVHLTRFRIGRSGMPFVLGGLGYLRELDDAQALAETGRLYHAGGGFKYLFASRSRGLVKGYGIRGDARLYFKDGGYELERDEPLRRFFAGGASLIIAF
jgi:hypothetical protein